MNDTPPACTAPPLAWPSLPDFLLDAERQSLEIGARGGAELQQIVTSLIDTPQDVLDQVRRVIQIKGAEAVKGTGGRGE